MSARRWTMTADHAAHAAANPPRKGYTCGAHAETNGGGCWNCGWQPPRKPRKVSLGYDRKTLRGVFLLDGSK